MRSRMLSSESVLSVDTYVWRLRQKLEEKPQNPAFITTVRGTGYMFQFLD